MSRKSTADRADHTMIRSNCGKRDLVVKTPLQHFPIFILKKSNLTTFSLSARHLKKKKIWKQVACHSLKQRNTVGNSWDISA